jgi:hypothetical protein
MAGQTGPRYKGWHNPTPTDVDGALDLVVNGNAIQSFGGVTGITSAGATSGALVSGRGTSSSPVTASTASKFISNYFSSSATSGETNGFYLRTYQTGAGGEVIAARLFGSVTDVAATNARGAHISLSFGTSGTVTGLAAALEATLHVPATAGMAGTNYAVKAAINADASTSDPVGATTLAFIGIVGQGDGTGLADVSTDAQILDVTGLTAATGVTNIISSTSLAELPSGTIGLRIKVNGTVYLIPAVVSTEWN